MNNRKLLSLDPEIRDELVQYATQIGLCPTATQVSPPGFIPLSTKLVESLAPCIGPNGIGPKRHGVGFVPCELDQPAFGAQFSLAYHALNDISHGRTSKDDLLSYGLKHVVEHVSRDVKLPHGVYICNGALILAALAHNYPVRTLAPWDDINVAIRLEKCWRLKMARNLTELSEWTDLDHFRERIEDDL